MGIKTIKEIQLQQFRQFMLEEEKSTATITKYMHDIHYFMEFADGKTLDKALVLEYKGHLSEQYATSSANSMLAALNSFFKFIERYDCCVKRFKTQKQIFCSEERELTRRDYEQLIRTAEKSGNTRLAMIIETIGSTGIRVSELPYLTVESLQCGQVNVSCKGKSRRVLLVRKLCKKLLRYAERLSIISGPVFITKSGTPVDRHTIWKQMKLLCGAAGVSEKKVFPHNLRHLFAKCFYEMEKDIVKLADILGHSNIDTTRIYTVTAGNEHRRKLEQMRMVL